MVKMVISDEDITSILKEYFKTDIIVKTDAGFVIDIDPAIIRDKKFEQPVVLSPEEAKKKAKAEKGRRIIEGITGMFKGMKPMQPGTMSMPGSNPSQRIMGGSSSGNDPASRILGNKRMFSNDQTIERNSRNPLGGFSDDTARDLIRPRKKKD